MLYWLRENCYHLHITAIKPSENHVNRGSLVEKVVVFHCNLPIVGDFNCYVDNTGDSDFIKFNRIAELINLKQHDNCSTHIKGHTLVLNLLCDEVISSDVKKISQMFLVDGSEELMW